MKGFFLNSRTAVVNGYSHELTGTEAEVEKIAKVLHQYGNVVDYQFDQGDEVVSLTINLHDDAFKFATETIMKEVEPGKWQAMPDFSADEEELRKFRQQEGISPAEEENLRKLRYEDSKFPPEVEKYLQQRQQHLNDLKSRGTRLLTDKKTGDIWAIVGIKGDPITGHKQVTIESSSGAKETIPMQELYKRFEISGSKEIKPDEFQEMKEDPSEHTNADLMLPANMKQKKLESMPKLTEKHPLTGETYDDTIPSEAKDEEGDDEEGFTSIDEPENEEDDTAERILNLFKDKEPSKGEKGPKNIDRLRQRKKYVDQIKTNEKIKDIVDRSVSKYEQEKGKQLTESQIKTITDNYMKNKFPDVDPDLYWEWVDKSKAPKPEDMGVTAFTFDGLLDLGFTKRIALQLGELQMGESTDVLDMANNQSIKVTKSSGMDGTPVYVIEDSQGKHAVGEGNPEIDNLQSDNALVVESFTEEQKKKLASLGFTI